MPKLSIVKIGGKVIDDLPFLSEFLTGFALIPNPKVLVHGGGASATKLAEQTGIPVRMVEGRRITDNKMLMVVVMVYAGWVNKQMVAMLQARKNNALGLSGADLDLIRSVKRPPQPIDYGYVGDVKQVNTAEFSKLLDQSIVPVIAPITHDAAGNLLNTNADTIATELAIALSQSYEVRLGYCFEKAGVLSDPDDERSVIESLKFSQYQNLKSSGQIHSGMIPKLDNGYRAVGAGVESVKVMGHREIHRWQPDVPPERLTFGTTLMIDEQ